MHVRVESESVTCEGKGWCEQIKQQADMVEARSALAERLSRMSMAAPEGEISLDEGREKLRESALDLVGGGAGDLREAIVQWYKGVPQERWKEYEWVLFILLVDRYLYPSFWRYCAVRWGHVVWTFNGTLEQYGVEPFADVAHVATGGGGATGRTGGRAAKKRNAIKESPPRIVELLNSVSCEGGAPNLLERSWADRYDRMVGEAGALVLGSLREAGRASEEADLRRLWEEERTQALPEAPAPPPPSEESAREKALDAAIAELQRLAAANDGVLDWEDACEVLKKLMAAHGCAAPMEVCMRPEGRALGVCGMQELWRCLASARGYPTSDEAVAPHRRVARRVPERRIEVRAPRLVLAIDRATGETQVRELDEYRDQVVPGHVEYATDWHAYFKAMCNAEGGQ